MKPDLRRTSELSTSRPLDACSTIANSLANNRQPPWDQIKTILLSDGLELSKVALRTICELSMDCACELRGSKRLQDSAIDVALLAHRFIRMQERLGHDNGA